ncbi:MAG: UvrD-helicase domain-containing protein [Defluviitaleaceae bacterium]|nr:UvrD-helicase domain-containing protein [Defluviitaleaceae bacterium]
MDFTKNLNPMQKEAVLHTDGPLLLLAGAGSGKTRVLTHRIANLIQSGVNPFNILAITFTNKAAKEMKERVNSLIPYGEVWVSTFHSTCVRILRRNIAKIGYENSFTIYDADDSERLIKQAMKELNFNDKLLKPKSVMAEIGSQKDNMISYEQFEIIAGSDFRLSKISQIYTYYQKRLRANNALDFDDIIFLTVKLFRDCPEVLVGYQERFKYILVDEYQDTNTSQYELIRLLAGKHKNLCVVGDDDQSIYGWRGANIRNILDFEKDFENATVIKLEQNYRSSKTILEAANAVIKNNHSRKSKSLWTDNNEGENIEFYKAQSDLDESRYITEQIEQNVLNGGKYSDNAILYRQNALSRSIEDSLVKNNIPYRIFSGVRFYERREIKDILAYLRLIHNPFDDISGRRVINVPKRGIGEASVEKILRFSTEQEISFSDALVICDNIEGIGTRHKKIKEFAVLIEELRDFSVNNNVSDLINQILEKTGYILELQAENSDEALGRIENIDSLINKAHEFEKESEDKTLNAFLEEVSLVADVDNYTDDDDTVVLMTLHSSKGLEFPNVFIPGFEENIFPSYRSLMSQSSNDLEEERRLCYVGITRARENLCLTSATSRLQNGQFVYNMPSRFLEEIPEDIVNSTRQNIGVSMKTINTIPAKKPNISFKTNNYDTINSTSKNSDINFKIGDKVKQIKYGNGTVIAISQEEVTVAFDGLGIKKIKPQLLKRKH